MSEFHVGDVVPEGMAVVHSNGSERLVTIKEMVDLITALPPKEPFHYVEPNICGEAVYGRFTCDAPPDGWCHWHCPDPTCEVGWDLDQCHEGGVCLNGHAMAAGDACLPIDSFDNFDWLEIYRGEDGVAARPDRIRVWWEEDCWVWEYLDD